MSMRRTSTITPSTATRHEGNEHDLELVKAIAQAWHSCSTASSRDAAAANEFNACRLNFQSQPSRFKVEAMQKAEEKSLVIVKYRESDSNNLLWDFSQSLWDSYEIAAVSKRLEIALVFDGSFAGIDELKRGVLNEVVLLGKRGRVETASGISSILCLPGDTTSLNLLPKTEHDPDRLFPGIHCQFH